MNITVVYSHKLHGGTATFTSVQIFIFHPRHQWSWKFFAKKIIHYSPSVNMCFRKYPSGFAHLPPCFSLQHFSLTDEASNTPNQILETFLQKPLAGITAPNECVLALYVSWPSSSPWPLPQTAPLTRSLRLLLRRSAFWYSASVPSSFVLLSPLPASVVSLHDTVGREKTHTVTWFDVQIYMTDTQFRVLNMHVWMCICIYKRVSQMSSPRNPTHTGTVWNYLHWQFFN